MAWSKHWKTRAATVSRWRCNGIQRLPGSVMIFRALSLKDLLSRRAVMPLREERKAVKSIQDRRASRESDNVSDVGRGFEYQAAKRFKATDDDASDCSTTRSL